MRGRPRIPDDVAKKAAPLAADGRYTRREVAAILGISLPTLRKILRERAPALKPARPKDRNKPPRRIVELALSLVRTGKTLAEVSRLTQISRATIARWAHTAGVPVRGRGRPRRTET
jgi:DNA-binding CsgD family transcriptional regulator